MIMVMRPLDSPRRLESPPVRPSHGGAGHTWYHSKLRTCINNWLYPIIDAGPKSIYFGYNVNWLGLRTGNYAWRNRIRYVKYAKKIKKLNFDILHDITWCFDIMSPYPEPGVSGDIIAPGAG